MAFLRPAAGLSTRLGDAGDGIVIRIVRAGKSEHEGELTINLLDGGLRLYAPAFSLGQIGQQRVAWVGALPGLHSAEALQIYRSLIRCMHGLRPRDLLVTSLRAM